MPGQSEAVERDVQVERDVFATQGHRFEDLPAATGAGHALERLKPLFDD
jgi:hypothetical protein